MKSCSIENCERPVFTHGFCSVHKGLYYSPRTKKPKQAIINGSLNVSAIQKYSDWSTTKIKNKAIRVFNAWIRKRDTGKPCISCGSRNTSQASHFYSAGKYNHMRFNPDNCHLACLQCNYYLSGNLLPYRKNLINKIGKERVEKLDFLASVKTPQKTNRFELIEIVEKYS